ncbi:MAG: division/cell wall cluster transcriptional repressor MraZ [Acidimicrobiales bacterium]
MFVGRFEHSLDDKGRIVLPAPWRSTLKSGCVLAPWDRCLALWTPEQFDTVAQAIKARIGAGEGDTDVMRIFFSRAHTVNPDSQGRFVIPAEPHRQHAALGRDAVVLGQFDRIEIWDRSRFGEMEGRKSAELDEAIRGLRL